VAPIRNVPLPIVNDPALAGAGAGAAGMIENYRLDSIINAPTRSEPI
jgi:hypothetical protein